MEKMASEQTVEGRKTVDVEQPVQQTKEIKEYTFMGSKLREAHYTSGDIYSREKVVAAQAQWEIDSTDRPYLAHIKCLSSTWPHLRLLADFMEVTTSPMRWMDFLTGKRGRDDRDAQASKTNVTRLDYLASGEVLTQSYSNPQDLRRALNEQSDETGTTQRKFRLFVVEDLSRDVIELLGASLDIEPGFFREQIFDYAWYNVRDRFMEPPRPNFVTRRQRWVQLRFVTARYFKTAASFKQGCSEAELFNVLRRPQDDLNNKTIWDDQGAIVGLSRARASFWLSSVESSTKGAVGVLLVDPTIKQGFPLWYGYLNWDKTPSIREKTIPCGPPRASLYADLIYWAQKTDAFRPLPTSDPTSNIHVPVQALLQLICGEWLTITEYIRTRLGQIEWEVSFPEHFLGSGSDIDVVLKKLHIWRRLVPLFREMLTETLQRVFQLPCHNINPSNIRSNSGSINNDIQSAGTTNGTNSPDCCQCPLHDCAPVNALRDDFTRLLSCMEEFQQRMDRLTSVITAIITMNDSRRVYSESKSIGGRLTWLITFFIPLSFIASLFSMQDDIGKLRDTMKWYFATSLVFFAVCLVFAMIMTSSTIRRLGRVAANLVKSLKSKI